MPHRLLLRGRTEQIYVYSGRSVLITNLRGQVTGSGSEGFHVDNTRVVSRDELLVDGNAPKAVSVSAVGADAMLGYYEVDGGEEQRSVFLEQSRFVAEGLVTRLRAANYGRRDRTLVLAWRIAADFADTDDTERGGERRFETDVDCTWDPADGRLRMRATDSRLDMAVAFRLDGVPPSWDGHALGFEMAVPARGSAEVTLAVEPSFDGRERRPPVAGFAAPRAGLATLRAQLAAEAPTLRSSNAAVERAWATAVADLASLPLGLAEGPAAPIAGLPLYQQFFGRDTLTIGWQALPAFRTPLRDALRANAAAQGRRIDDWLDEEPGKMIHQARWGPVSRLGIDPFTRYYGDFATVPDFLIMLGQYLAWTADFETIRELLPAARAAVDWIERYADLDRDGFIEYRTRSRAGVKNQGWLDSDDAIVDERGEIVPNPIATAELQAYAYAGLQQAAIVFAACGDIGFGAEVLQRARRLRWAFDRRFWWAAERTYAMGLGPSGAQIRSVASNAGHVLAAGLVPSGRGRAVANRLMQPDTFSGWGIRTLSSDHPAFNPFSYHRGTVWPVEQATIGFGFARYGAWGELDLLAKGFFDTSELFGEGRLPEVVGGIQRDAEHPHPGIYPDSCEPQGWSSSAVIQMVQALLGMVAVAPARLLVIDPHLPSWLPDLRLEGLTVGSSRVDLAFRRTSSGATGFEVTRRDGMLAVVRQPPPQSAEATPWGRVRALAASFVGR
ncbi:MAG TPA: glycogen debranching N-terminal domain-containing protein [Candidatus Limnocylindria bacterium]|nr:glycogen debranching N-terminal domain-containing protein [Candidatus Limnocylindria bacterium]